MKRAEESAGPLAELQRSWDEFGRRDALWAVITDPAKKDRKWDEGEFFESGRKEIDRVLSLIKPHLFAVPKTRALDFGCGVGRLSAALADRFEEVIGVDIAPSMIAEADRLNRFGTRCRFLLNARDDLQIFPDDHFAFIYSIITLQHIDPDYSRRYLREFLRVLQPGGFLVFQLPTRPVRLVHRLLYRLGRKAWYDRQRRKSRGYVMEMHGLPRREVERIIDAAGGKITRVLEDNAAGRKWLSWTYFVFKPGYDLRLAEVKLPRAFHENETARIRLRVENRSLDASEGIVKDPQIRVGGKLFPVSPPVSLHSLKEYRADIPLPLEPGRCAEVEMKADFGGLNRDAYWLYLDIVHENKCWLSEVGFAPVIKKIQVT